MPADVFHRAATIGPYFAVDAAARGAGWRPLTDLLDPATVVERAEYVRAALAARGGLPADRVELRVGASIHFLGFASRLVAPSLAVAALDGVVPVFTAANVSWQRAEPGPVPVAVTAPGSVTVVDGPAAATALLDGVVVPVVGPLVESFARAARLSTVVLWGNVASALAGAAAVVARSGEPTVLDPAAIVAALLARPGPLAGTGRFAGPGRAFVRDNCCLLYRVPGAGKCGDCVLRG